MITAGRYRSWATTHDGTRRKHNEDAFVNRPDLGLWAVADGAGGHTAGDLASGMIAEALEGIPPGLGAAEMMAAVRLRIADVHAALREEAQRRGEAVMIASTVVVLVVRGEHFACLWAGDSRAYLLRAGVLRQVSHDHSLVQELIDSGAIAPEDAEHHPHANVITRAVGAAMEDVALDKMTERAQPGDRFLLCSDGLSKFVEAEVLAALLAPEAGERPSEALVAAALERQTNDNVTAVVVEIG